MGKLFCTTTSANMPFKMLLNSTLNQSLNEKRQVIPIHAYISPTNKCDENCSFCSFKTRDRSVELSLAQIEHAVDTFKSLGVLAVTLTGGGEPLCHSGINDIISYIVEQGLECGLVTNGNNLDKLNEESINLLSWCRVSLGDSLNENRIDKVLSQAKKVKQIFPQLKLSFSYVVLKEQNPDLQLKAAIFVQENGIYNIRFSPDQFCPEAIDMRDVHLRLVQNSLDKISIIEFKPFASSFSECYLYLLRPFLGADGYIQACCCTQYCDPENKDDKKYRVCTLDEYAERVKKNLPFLSSCNKCFYNSYNEYFIAAKNEIEDLSFV